MDRNKLQTFFEGDAKPEEKEKIKKWLEQSESHVEELLKEREFFDTLILSGDEERIKRKSKKPTLMRKLLIETIKIAAVVTVMFFIGAHIYNQKLKEVYETTTTVVAPAGQRVNLLLPDGTEVWLNARSKLTYPIYLKGAKREVELEGEAYFDVPYCDGQSFVVHTRHYDIDVLGTRFNVETYPDKDEFSTALLEGLVKVTNRNRPGKSVKILPDHKITGRNGELTTSPIEDYDIYRWREGMICFKETRFQELMERFEKSFGFRIVVKNNEVANKVFSGKFRISDGIENALRLLQKDGKYTFERKSDEPTIIIN